jgi:hypothetical protein
LIPAGWENFYVVTASAAATLIGLMFVVITLGADIAKTEKAKGVAQFVTPTFVHFGGVLFSSLVLLVPWPSVLAPCIILGCSAAAALIYVAFTIRGVSRLDFLNLNWLDYLFYFGLPFLADVGLIAFAVGLTWGIAYAPYGIAATIALQLLVATRNSWNVALWLSQNR